MWRKLLVSLFILFFLSFFLNSMSYASNDISYSYPYLIFNNPSGCTTDSYMGALSSNSNYTVSNDYLESIGPFATASFPHSINVSNEGGIQDNTTYYGFIYCTSPVSLKGSYSFVYNPTFTASNISFTPLTGMLSFDYIASGSASFAAANDIQIVQTSGGNRDKYWVPAAGTNLSFVSCTSSHCDAELYPSAPDSGVSRIRIWVGVGQYSQDLDYPLSMPTNNTSQTPRYDTQLYPLSLSSDTTTTTNTTVSFGSVTLPVKSNVCIIGTLGLQNNTSASGMEAQLFVDSTSYALVGDTVAFSSLGITYNVAKNLCIPNMAAGSHTFAVKIDQFPFRSGDQIVIKSDSTLWITASPTQ